MRFLMLNWRDPKNPRAGGAERVSLGYLAALVERGHHASWFTHDFPGALREEHIQGVQIIRGGGVGSSILNARRWAARQAPFDLVIDQHHGIPWFAPWWCGTHCVAFIHEVLGPIWNVFYKWPWNVIGRSQERWTHWLYRRVPFWTACESTRTTLHAHGVRNVTVLPYGVHTRALPELDSKSLQPPLRLISVSRLAPNKRVHHASRALNALLASGTAATLKIVGTGEIEPQLRQLTRELGLEKQITFTGPLDEAEKDAALRESHFLLHTSQREGWGLNVIEANAMGTPSVVYPVAGLIESTLHRQTGLVSELESPESLAASIGEAVRYPELYQTWRRNAWARAKTFHWDIVLPKACDWLEARARGDAFTP